MRKMKYVMNRDTEEFLIFPDTMLHSRIPGKWTSAGFVVFDSNYRDECGNIILRARVSGKSTTLNLSSDEVDNAIINRAIKPEWLVGEVKEV